MSPLVGENICSPLNGELNDNKSIDCSVALCILESALIWFISASEEIGRLFYSWVDLGLQFVHSFFFFFSFWSDNSIVTIMGTWEEMIWILVLFYAYEL